MIPEHLQISLSLPTMSPKAEKKVAEKKPPAEKTRIAEKYHEAQNSQHEKKLTNNSTAAVGE